MLDVFKIIQNALKSSQKYTFAEKIKNKEKISASARIFQALKECKTIRLKHDLFTACDFVSFDNEPFRPLTNDDISQINLRLVENGFYGYLNDKVLEKQIKHRAYLHSFDAPTEWLKSIKWDGTERITDFFSNVWGLENSEYYQYASEYMWSALASCAVGGKDKKDIMIVLTGRQNIGKTTFVTNLVPFEEWYTNLNFKKTETELVLKILECLVAEFAELSGLADKELEQVKSFLTQTNYRIRRLYHSNYTNYTRRTLFFGTTNKLDFLTDEENRRFLVINLATHKLNLSYLQENLAQLWAEGYELYQKHGVMFENAEKEAKKYHFENEQISTIEEALNDFLDNFNNDQLTILQIIKYLQNNKIPLNNSDRKNRLEIGKILRKNGWENKAIRINNKIIKIWIKKP